MGSCENSTIVGHPSGGSFVEQHSCLEYEVQSVSVQPPSSEVVCNVLGSDVDCSNAPSSCIHFPRKDSYDYVSCNGVGGISIADRYGTESESKTEDVLISGKTLDDNNNLGSGVLCSRNGEFEGEVSCEMPSESNSANSLVKSSDEQGEPEDDNAIRLAERTLTDGFEKTDDAVCILTDVCHQPSILGDSEMPSKLVTMNGFSIDHPQWNEQAYIKSAGDPSLEVLDKNDDLSGRQLSDSHGKEVSSRVPCVEVKSNFEHLCDGTDGNVCYSPPREKVTEAVDEECDTGIPVLSDLSQVSQKTLEADSLNKSAQQKLRDDSCEGDPYIEDAIDVVDQNASVGNCVLVKIKNNIIPLEDKTCDLKDGCLGTDSDCAFEKPVSLPSCQTSAVMISSSLAEDVPILLAKDDIGSIGSSSVVAYSGKISNCEKDSIKVDLSERKCSNIASSSSRRCSRTSKSNPRLNTQTKRAIRKCKNKATMPHPGSFMENIFEAARRKRSCLSKPARSSMWGILGNIKPFLDRSNGASFNQVESQELGKAKCSRGSGRRNKKCSKASSQGSVQGFSVPTTRVRLRVKIGGEISQSCVNILVPEIDDGLSASHSAPCLDSEKVAGDIEEKYALEGRIMGNCISFNDLKKDACMLNDQPSNSLADSILIFEKSAGDTADLYLATASNKVIKELNGAPENKSLDPGTSPDSEVINSIPEVQVGERNQEAVQDTVLTSGDFVSNPNVTRRKRGKKKDKLLPTDNCILEYGFPVSPGISKAKLSKKYGRRKNRVHEICSNKCVSSFTHSKDSINSSSSGKLPMASTVLSRETVLGAIAEGLDDESGLEAKASCSLDVVDYELSESQVSERLLPSARAVGNKISRSYKSGQDSKDRRKTADSINMRGTTSGRKEKQQKSVSRKKHMEEGGIDQIFCQEEIILDTEKGCRNRIEDETRKSISDSDGSIDASNLCIVHGDGLEEQGLPPRNAWVRCDDCHKWRRIPAMLADLIEETNCTWTCKDSKDKEFADCSIPQEKSNAEINEELGLSEASGEEDANDGHKNYSEFGSKRRSVLQESTFTCIMTNEFLHRSRKTQTIDEIMVCHCKPPQDGKFGCGDECLNRLLNIECVQGTCPCGKLCSNQQFQKRNYAKLEWFRCGKKGYGLQAIEDISKGRFLIEYVGEVLDMHAYEARQRDYALKGHRHFYFMTLNGSEVIDASAKGNLGRFINHSCEPNCRTEKWIVNGEICIGLFALRDIKKGEEVTFDYNYVRVFGAAAKKCYCGAHQCRGYIGGDPLNTEVIVHGDSDEEFPEPVMLTEDGMPQSASSADARMRADEHISEDRNKFDKSSTTSGTLGISMEKEHSENPASAVSQVHGPVIFEDSNNNYLPIVKVDENSQQMENVSRKPIPSTEQETPVRDESMIITSDIIGRPEIFCPSITQGEVLPAFVDTNNRESRIETREDKHGSSKLHAHIKSSRSNGFIKKGRVWTSLPNADKVQVSVNKSLVVSIKTKKVMEGSLNGQFDAVQEKLNELLDKDGGISKRKDATKGYLKLLLLTAASGDSGNGEAIQSNRDLSMILDALLKTKSRTVLTDIINKNGLRMLHNIMKKYRQEFKKIPILRKLLKVLEYLAVSKILTYDHINGGPPCHGMESFRESILSLTEHDDKQVHQIARSFRDRWMPRPLRKHAYVDRDEKVEFRRVSNGSSFSAPHSSRRDQDVRPSEAIDCVKHSVRGASVDACTQEGCAASSIMGLETNEPKRRKRKSRWDQPAEATSDSGCLPHKGLKIDFGQSEQFDSRKIDDRDKIGWESGHSSGHGCNYYQQGAAFMFDSERQNIHEDAPPGFSSPSVSIVGSMNCLSDTGDLPPGNYCNSAHGWDVIFGHPQEKFNSRLPVSYGIPLSLVQLNGTPHSETMENWVIAPGIPFSPFPPLPPYPRDKKDHPPPHNPLSHDQHAQIGQRGATHCATSCYVEDSTPSTTGSKHQHVHIPVGNKQFFKREKGSSNDLSKRFFRQRKWKHTKPHYPHWDMGSSWVCNENNSKQGISSSTVVNVPNQTTYSYSSKDAIYREETADNNLYQHMQLQNQH